MIMNSTNEERLSLERIGEVASPRGDELRSLRGIEKMRHSKRRKELAQEAYEDALARQQAIADAKDDVQCSRRSVGAGYTKRQKPRRDFSHEEKEDASPARHRGASSLLGKTQKKAPHDWVRPLVDQLEAADRSAAADVGTPDDDVPHVHIEPSAPPPPPIINSIPCPSSFDLLATKYNMLQASQSSRWPIFVTYTFPLVLESLLILCLRPLIVWFILFLTVWCQFILTVFAVRLLRDRDRLMSIVCPPLSYVDPTLSIDEVCLRIESYPEMEHPQWWRCLFVWYLQCLSAFTLNLNHVVSGVCFHFTTGKVGQVDHEIRPYNQAGNKPCPYQTTVDAWIVVSLSSWRMSYRVSAGAMVDQFQPLLQTLSPDQRKIQAASMACRVTNLMIPSRQSKFVVRGSADAALSSTITADVSNAIYDEAKSTFLPNIDLTFMLVLVLVLSFIVPARTMSGAWYDAIVGSDSYISILLAPFIEEPVKWLFARAFGVTTMVSSPIFGVFEFGLRGCQINALPALLMHCLTGFCPFVTGIMVHYAFNLSVLTHRFYDHMSYVPGPKTIKEFASKLIRSELAGPPVAFGSRLPWNDTKLVNAMCEFALRPSWSTAIFTELYNTHMWWFEDNVDFLCPGSSLLTVGLLVGMFVVHRSLFPTLVLGINSTLYAVGYRKEEVNLPPLAKHGAKIKYLPTYFMAALRVSACCSLGFVLRNVVPPFPDFFHPPSALYGCLQRFCRDPPKANRRLLRRLRRYVRIYVRRHFDPLASDADVSFETWLKNTDYPEWRKEQLRSVWKNKPWVEEKDLHNKSFIKKEFYGAFKPPRGINSRSDTFKCATGPFFKAMEHVLYAQECFDGTNLVPGKHGAFIKHIPTHLRPQFIKDMFGSSPGPYYETDYSQFEKHFTPEIMLSLELILYKHMLLHFPEAYKLIETALSGTNKCHYRGFIIKILGRRMSGDMCTSLGNGFSNLMLFKFAAAVKGGTAFGVVEGDDALFVSSVRLTTADFADLGFDIKILVHSTLYATSFCGMLQSEDGILLRDIGRVMPKFGWSFSPRRLGGHVVKMGLLRARALSLAYESPQCPILCALSKRALDLTSGSKPIFESDMHHQELQNWVSLFGQEMMEKLSAGPTLQARVDFFTHFGISVSAQIEAERLITKWDGSPLCDAFIESLFADSVDMFKFAERYVATTPDLAKTLMDCHSN